MPASVTDLKPRSLLALMAEKFNLSPDEFKRTVKKTCNLATASDEEFTMFIGVAHKYDLDPFVGDIHAFIKKGGGVQVIMGYGGWTKKMNEHPAFDGIEYRDDMHGGSLTSVTCIIHRKDRTHPTSVTEYMKECKRGTDPWNNWPNRMLRIKATNQAIRLAFSLSGIMDPDEFERYQDMLADQKKRIEQAGTTALDSLNDIPEEPSPTKLQLTPDPEPEEPKDRQWKEVEEPEPPEDEFLGLDEQDNLATLVVNYGWPVREVGKVIEQLTGGAVDQIKVSQFKEVAEKIAIAGEARRKAKEKTKK